MTEAWVAQFVVLAKTQNRPQWQSKEQNGHHVCHREVHSTVESGTYYLQSNFENHLQKRLSV